ncbi:DUF5677 domain-containing protein [Leuconostoc pseudomesenteroides]|uniref:DUF5677 domain-containing protein n=1 Tax=Leuconostoc pseudomesenteroides TaxID=33968 RepID=UPI00289DC888|nr:DUF5677 domain-containing protein [Leuconostoc pseudomesenteroides]
MFEKFPDFESIFEEGKKQLLYLKTKAISNANLDELTPEDKLLFDLVGNMNIRLNTMLFLLKNNMTDGVSILERTIFELHIAFVTYSHSKNKSDFVNAYVQKSNFEGVRKLMKSSESDVFSSLRESIPNLFETLSKIKEISEQNLNGYKKVNVNKVWYEIASNSSTFELSKKYLTNPESIYYVGYDEPSNWVHSQRLGENMDSEFNNKADKNFFPLVIDGILMAIQWLLDDIAEIALYIHSELENDLHIYLKKVIIYGNQVKKLTLNQEIKDGFSNR